MSRPVPGMTWSAASSTRQDAYNQGRRSTQFPDAPPGLFYRGDPGVPEDGTKPDWNNVSGRFGLHGT